ncbi:MAG: alanine--glyoxylate aminotransferase family protein [Nitrososphaerota archaeon]|nr:alanine--glyoxylate aminotransferase family protein [Nitrososphaerota archaeon]
MYNRARNGIKLLMTAGPVEVSPRVLSALAQPSIYHYYGGFIELFEETTKKMSEIFQARDRDTLILQGEGVLGLEASVACTINPGEKVIVFENGPFGKWFGDYVKNAGAEPVYFHEEPNKCFDTSKALEFLEKHRDATAMTLVNCETPAGLLNPPKEICKKAKSLGMLTIVDCVASLAGAEYKPSDWEIDISIGASQKCLGSTPGLTPMAISKFAWERMEKKKSPVKISYLSLLDWKESWIESKRFPFTPFTAEVYALSAALDEILEEGLENVLKRHAEVARICRERAKDMSLKTWPVQDEFCSPTVTALSLPEHMDDTKIIQDVARKYGILIGGGYRELKGKVLRIGHMGYQAQKIFIAATMDALEDVLGVNTTNSSKQAIV